jgi:tetratricopeptide (TPR) repeat protein
MFGAARKGDSMNQCLLQASTSFRQMCVLQSPFILTAASTMLTWLLVHAEGSLSERVMRTSFQVATEALGCQNPASVLLEWMTAAAAADKLKVCRIDSARLRQLWQGFNQALGEEHGHTIVALYCLSFNLMFADKNFAQAERHLEYLCVVSARVFGPDDIQTINILAALSRAQHRQKKYLLALETINRSLIAAPLGLNHPHRLELLLRKALIVWKLKCMKEMEELYWIVVKGRVATLGIHHRTTIAAHNSLVDVLHWNGTWEARKGDAHRLLGNPQVSVSEYESWWRRVVEGSRADQNQDRASSEEGE